MRCSICGGVTTCPAGEYLDVRPPFPEEVVWLGFDEAPPEPGWVLLSRNYYTRESIWARVVGKDGLTLVQKVGAAQMGRIRAHYPQAKGMWVSAIGAFIFYARFVTWPSEADVRT